MHAPQSGAQTSTSRAGLAGKAPLHADNIGLRVICRPDDHHFVMRPPEDAFGFPCACRRWKSHYRKPLQWQATRLQASTSSSYF